MCEFLQTVYEIKLIIWFDIFLFSLQRGRESGALTGAGRSINDLFCSCRTSGCFPLPLLSHYKRCCEEHLHTDMLIIPGSRGGKEETARPIASRVSRRCGGVYPPLPALPTFSDFPAVLVRITALCRKHTQAVGEPQPGSEPGARSFCC